ncbi:organoarsenical effux MFS transporter ArsJ [Lentisphaera marina]|uniref:organoarsenical effux MFS transporter ArsJ n=1 Tax=Lentisphaera marina TaxID=1111041 RepID=UPI00236690CC|nr:organoarsenical effux MFS transporter ArsJ [Lentisphaera marina]MDD7986096.1 organoarsenical effux MFS transporter ArsJ [Lentisphaera marina]
MKNIKDYCIVTAAYWSFMLTDGALRMLCLLYFHSQGFSPVELAFMFLLYELCGVLTNLFGGWYAQRKGLRQSLISGLCLQVFALSALSQLSDNWKPALSLAFVMGAQAFAGVAKDLTKMSSKTAVKFLVPDDSSKLFKWTAVLTGSKNAVKGLGFFFGAFLLQNWGFSKSLLIMAAGIAVILIMVLWKLKGDLGQVKSKDRLKDFFNQGRKINLLAAARVFLFGARDIWFVVAVPVFFHEYLHWSFTQVGTFHALWVIAYGAVQSSAPKILKTADGSAGDNNKAFLLSLTLCASMALIIVASASYGYTSIVLVGGLMLFGFFFALNSSFHSYLILSFSNSDKAAMSVGFYYMANAIGRLFGTLLSGILYQVGGLIACLIGSLIFLISTSVISKKLQFEK